MARWYVVLGVAYAAVSSHPSERRLGSGVRFGVARVWPLGCSCLSDLMCHMDWLEPWRVQ